MIEPSRPRTIVVRYEHEVDALDRVAGILRRQRVRAEAFTAVASHDRATVQATIMFDSSDKTAARIVALLERQVGVLAVEDWTATAKGHEEIMAKMIHDSDVDLSAILGRRVAVIGYGSQGHAHALNLKDSGVDVRVGIRPGSRGWLAAEKAGFAPLDVAAAAAWADTMMIVVPDLVQPDLFRQQIAPHLTPGKMIMFAHGFAIRFGWITPPEGVDVSMVAPKAPGHRVREVFKEGAGVPGLVAIHHDATGQARAKTLAYAKAIGCTRAGVIETTFSEETETDLFGEQAVLCGGVSALVTAGFETLVEAGYQPEIAYFECLHELKLIVDLMYRGGLGFMRYSVSDTAEHGDYTGGPRLVTAETKQIMRQILAEIRSGAYAEKLAHETKNGWFQAERERQRDHQIEQVGAKLRAKMPFLEPSAAPKEEPAAI